MRAFFGILFIAASLFGYEINHENWAKFYKFSGDANGVNLKISNKVRALRSQPR